jgi:hypothetical protein
MALIDLSISGGIDLSGQGLFLKAFRSGSHFRGSKMGDWDIFFDFKAWCYCMHPLQTWQPRSEENKQSPPHTPVLSLVN